VELQEVVLKAQVAEAADLRKKARDASRPAAKIDFLGSHDVAEFGTWVVAAAFVLTTLIVIDRSPSKAPA
jgi:hypothetical protein